MGARVARIKKMDRRVAAVLTLIFLVLAICTTTVRAQTGGGYELTWYTVDGGGGAVSGGAYTLVGTVGQADAAEVNGCGYVLVAGFRSGGVYTVYLPLVVR